MPDVLAFFNALHDYSAGTLWRVREDLLKERVKHYNCDSDRYCHPALSVRRTPLATSLERIPMLVGGSKRRGGSVAVRGVFPARGEDYPTHFGNTLAPLLMADFTEPADLPDRQLADDMLSGKRVAVNWHKPRLDADEMERIEAWMTGKGL